MRNLTLFSTFFVSSILWIFSFPGVARADVCFVDQGSPAIADMIKNFHGDPKTYRSPVELLIEKCKNGDILTVQNSQNAVTLSAKYCSFENQILMIPQQFGFILECKLNFNDQKNVID